MTTCRIWVPSQQRYIRMHEMSCDQYRNILKTVDDDIDFEFTTNEFLQNNLYDKKIDLEAFTVIDKFLIFVQLKIHSCSTKLNLTRVCETCETKTNFSIDLNRVLDQMALSIDRPFLNVFDFGDMQITCDVPSINLSEEVPFDKENFSERIDNYLYSFIRSLTIKGHVIDLDHKSLSERVMICQNIPFATMNHIRKNYIDSLHKVFHDLLLVKTPCSNTKCKDELVMSLDVTNITDVVKFLFKDNSAINILTQMASVSNNCHFDYSYYKNISPAELSILYSMVAESGKSQDDTPDTNKEINLFEEYRLESQGMVETPSEFQ